MDSSTFSRRESGESPCPGPDTWAAADASAAVTHALCLLVGHAVHAVHLRAHHRSLVLKSGPLVAGPRASITWALLQVWSQPRPRSQRCVRLSPGTQYMPGGPGSGAGAQAPAPAVGAAGDVLPQSVLQGWTGLAGLLGRASVGRVSGRADPAAWAAVSERQGAGASPVRYLARHHAARMGWAVSKRVCWLSQADTTGLPGSYQMQHHGRCEAGDGRLGRARSSRTSCLLNQAMPRRLPARR